MEGDGGGWTQCREGHRHWGRFGAAGLLAHAALPDGRTAVLLQLRAPWSHLGGTWALPGGARDSTESPAEAALREAWEEAALDATRVEVHAELPDDPCGWTYTTVLARAAEPFPVAPANPESDALRWVPFDEVDRLPLHPRFAEVWPALRTAVDAG